MRPSIPFVVLCLLLPFCRPATAHSMYQSSLLLDYHSATLDAELQLPASRLSQVMGLNLTKQTLPSVRQQIEAYILQRLHVRSEPTEWPKELTAPVSWQIIDGAPYVVVHLHLTPPAGASLRRLTLEDDVITDTLSSHAVLVSVRSDWNSSTFANDPELLGVLNGEERSIEIDRNTGGWAKGFGSVFHLGVRHIAEGTDHLLFLLALLLPAPLLCRNQRWAEFAGLRHGFVQILKVVTAFTVGHSITLALAASGVVRVPGRPIEILIAVSILISAIHAIRPLFPGREAFIAAGFGLIHGLAFASTLAELGLHRWERVASILAFNLGIETMQLVVVLCVMPSLMLLSRTVLYTPFRLAGAALSAFAASGWIIERSTERSLRIDLAVNVLADHSITLAVALFVAAWVTFYALPYSRPRSRLS
jgi:hypothetical protein